VKGYQGQKHKRNIFGACLHDKWKWIDLRQFKTKMTRGGLADLAWPDRPTRI